MLDHLDLDRVTFAGHSMGGGIGYLLGIDHAHRLDRLVLMAPIPAGGIAGLDPEARRRRLQLRRDQNRDALLAEYRGARFRPEVETDAWLESRVEHVLGVSDGHFEASAESMVALDVGHRLPELETPTLMLAGAVDELLRANLQDFLALPNATLEVLSRAGHEVAVHEPDAVARAIDAFMNHGPVTARHIRQRMEAESG